MAFEEMIPEEQKSQEVSAIQHMVANILEEEIDPYVIREIALRAR